MNISLHADLYGGAGLPSVTEHPNLKSRAWSGLKIKPMRSSSRIKGGRMFKLEAAWGPGSPRETREVDLAEEGQQLMPAL